MRSNFHETFIFLTKLMYKNRIILPTLISVAFLVCNFRWEIEISIQTERIAMPQDMNDDDNNSDGSIDYSSNEEYELASTTDGDDESSDEITLG